MKKIYSILSLLLVFATSAMAQIGTAITATDQLSNDYLYTVVQASHSQGATSWAVATGGSKFVSNADIDKTLEAGKADDVRQQFAFINNEGALYLYHAAEKKFVNKDGSLSTKPVDEIKFQAGAFANTFFAFFDATHYVNVGGSRQMAIDSWSQADGGNSCTITPVAEFDPTEALKQFETEVPEVPATPLSVVSVSPSEAVASLSELVITFSDEVAGQFDPYEMSKFMKLKKGNSVAAGVSNYVVNGAVLTVTLDKEVTEAGEYTLVIPEGLITRKSDGAAYSGELTFTLEEEPVAVPDAELAETYTGTCSINFMGAPTEANVSLDFDKDGEGNAKAGYAYLLFSNVELGPVFNAEVPYEVKGNTVVLKGIEVATGENSDDTKEVDLTFTVQEDGKLLSNDQVYGPGFLSSILFDFSQCPLAPKSEVVDPETPEVPSVKLASKYNGKFDIGGALVDGSLLIDQDVDGTAKAGYASLCFNLMGTPFNTSAPYELTETTLTMKGAVVGDGGMMGINKEEDIVFTINEDGSLTSTQKIYGNTQSTAYFAIQLSSDKFVPEATTPETPVALELVSIEPADGAKITEFNTVTFTFNKPVKLVESDETGVLLMYNGMPAGQLWGEVSEDGKTAVLSMGMPVNMEGTYTVYAMEGAFEDLDGNKSAEMTATYTLAGAADSFTYTYAAPSTEMTQSYLSYISLGFASAVAEVKTDALNVVDGNGNVVTTATIAADWFDEQAVEVVFEEEVSYTGTCSLTVPEGFITSALGTYNPEFTLTYNLEAEPVQAYFYHPEYNGVMVMDSVSNVATIKKNFTLEDMEANAWELHPVGKNQFKIANKATGLYLGACSTSVPVAGVDAANAKVYEMQKDGIYDVLKDVEGGNYTYLHVAASQSDKIVGWEAAAAASHWFVLNNVEDYEYLLANLELVDSLNQVIAKAEALKEQAQPYYKPLITSATQFTSNAKEASEGSYEALLDGKDNTFFHTEWSATTTSDAHNLQVLVPGNELTELWVKYQARNAGGAYNDRPTKMSIYGGTMAEDGTVTYETTAFANLTTADGIGEVAGEFKFTADKAYDAFKFEVHETVMSTGNTGNKWFTYGEFQMYSQTMTPADVTMNETQAAGLDEALGYAKNANPVEDAYSVLIDELNRAINKVLFPAATVESVDPACGHYTEMPGTVKLTFSADVQALEFGMVRTDFTGFRGYNLSEEDYTINGKELTVTVPAEYVTNAANMMITLGVIDANGQYVTYASDPDYLSEDCVFLMYTADMKSNIFMMSAVDPEEGEVETLEVINMTFGEGNTYVGGFDTTKEVVVLNADGDVVTKATMEVVKESEEDPDTNETYSWPTATVKFTLAAPVTEAGEYTLVVPEGTVYNEGFYEDAEDLGVSWGAIYNPEVRVAYTVAGVVEEYPINFDKDQDATRTDRVLSTVSLAVEGEAAQELTVANTRKAYNDMTAGEVKFVCAPGATLTPAFNYSGVWMHGYVYVDFGQDGDFSFDATTNDQTGKDLVSYSFYGVDSENYGYNSANQYISGDGRSTLVCPAFTAPETPGEYRVRFKVDWNNVDAGGCVDSNNHILNNGGYIVDATLVVDEATAINGVSIENMNDVYTLDGRKVVVKAGQKLNKGLYIVGGKKVYVK